MTTVNMEGVREIAAEEVELIAGAGSSDLNQCINACTEKNNCEDAGTNACITKCVDECVQKQQ
jgi:hypothetical protein